MTAALEIRGLCVSYGRKRVLGPIDLDVAAGETIALLGPSGAGKTTLLSAVAGFVPIEGGEIAIGGRTVARVRGAGAGSGDGRGRTIAEPPERRNVGVVFQSAALWPHLSALDTVAFPYRRRGFSTVDARAHAAELLARVGILALAERRPAELSGGEQQRVGLARAFARGAGLYLFDEPTAHLDTALRAILQQEIVDQRRRDSAAAVHATHDVGEALSVADRVALMRDGSIVQVGTPVEVYECPVDLWAAQLTGPASVVEAVVGREGAIRVGGIPLDDQVVMLAGAGSAAPSGDGSTVRLVVRPEWARLDGPLRGVIASVAYRGSHTDYGLDPEPASPAGAAAASPGRVTLRAEGPPSLRAGAVATWRIERAWPVGGEPPR